MLLRYFSLNIYFGVPEELNFVSRNAASFSSHLHGQFSSHSCISLLCVTKLAKYLLLHVRKCLRLFFFYSFSGTAATDSVYRGADTSLARTTSLCILFVGENISFDASLVAHIYICI